jgi:hypothetical protein
MYGGAKHLKQKSIAAHGWLNWHGNSKALTQRQK